MFLPRYGPYWHWKGFQQRLASVQCEDTIKHLYNAEYNGLTCTVASLAGVLGQSRDQATAIVETCQRLGLVVLDGETLKLTPQGRVQALHVIRVHRLLECYLAERTGVSHLDWHAEADRLEHGINPSEADRLDFDLGFPTHDPHGDPIPTAAGILPPRTGQLLSELVAGQKARFIHVEDEPPAVYAQLCAMGIRPGMMTHVLDSSDQLMVLSIGGASSVVSKMLASHVTVLLIDPSSESEHLPEHLNAHVTLATTRVGQTVTIKTLTSACRGLERTRLLDLGFVPGSKVENVMVSPLGDPTVYRVRGALVALRENQARLIGVTLS